MSQQIRLEEHVYERIKASKRADESFSEAVERLVGGRSLRDLRDVFDEEQAADMRKTSSTTSMRPSRRNGNSKPRVSHSSSP